MKCCKKIFLSLFFVFAVSFCFAKNFDLDEFHRVNTIESDFEMRTLYSFSKQPIISGGKLYFKKPDLIKWEYLYPAANRGGFLFEKKKILSWTFTNNGVKEIADISKSRQAKGALFILNKFLNMDITALEKIYTVETVKNSMIFYPKKSAGSLEKIEVYLQENMPAVQRIIIFNEYGDKTEIYFTEIKINGEIAQNAFDI
ncbi:MAG: outer membrane lipoprotein carrier protein LolA [Elusimicrobiota bacterium]|jgi:outer membrane lipoprotein carrier protein|nr:outer membrane lipoprotein carrier protein LolA [Elusimicrobiota bacterium]